MASNTMLTLLFLAAVLGVYYKLQSFIFMPVFGLTHGLSPIMGYNYGAGEYRRVKQAITFSSVSAVIYTAVVWILINLFPEFFIRIFNQDTELVAAGVHAMRIYYFGFFFQSLQKYSYIT